MKATLARASEGDLRGSRKRWAAAPSSGCLVSLLGGVRAVRPLWPHDSRRVDLLIAQKEASRDLSRVWAVVDMVRGATVLQRSGERIPPVPGEQDMFYAAVEMLDDPSLVGKPVAVGGMSMISTANYEARKCVTSRGRRSNRTSSLHALPCGCTDSASALPCPASLPRSCALSWCSCTRTSTGCVGVVCHCTSVCKLTQPRSTNILLRSAGRCSESTTRNSNP